MKTQFHAVGAKAVAFIAGLVCLLSTLVFAGAAVAADPTFEPDPNSLGSVTFYNASGSVISSGAVSARPFAAYFAASGTGVAAGDNLAQASFATPQDAVNTALWSQDTSTGTSNYGSSVSHPGALAGSNKAIAAGSSQDINLADYIGEFPAASTANPNIYQVRIYTNQAGNGGNAKYYSADIQVSGSTWTQIYPAPAAAGASTTTAVTASPASPAVAGTNVTFTATVTPSAAGSVQFKDGPDNLGSPLTVMSGAAMLSTTALTAGTHSITAVFTPTDTAAYSGSTSPAVSYSIATATSTSLTVTPTNTADANTHEVLSATVMPNTAVGTVTFKDGGTTIGAAQPVSGGTASTTATLQPGTHSLTAVFTPTSAAAFVTSTSSAVGYIVKSATTTTVGASPASPQPAAAMIAFAATITPKIAGSVQFKDGGTNLGSAISVPADSGVAQLPARTLSLGTHPITAVFTPTNTTDNSASTSAPLQYVIAEAPDAPTGVQATPVNMTANVTWVAPADNGGTPITGYDVQYSLDGVTWSSGPASARTSTVTKAVVTGLANGRGYLFRVKAINGVDSSAYQPTAAKVTPVADASVVSMSAPRSVRHATAATISTIVTDARDRSRVRGAVVSLYRIVAGQKTYTRIRTLTTSASGTAAYRLTVSANSAFYWRLNGNAAHKAANSRAVLVAVTPKVSISAKGRKIKHGKSIRIYGGSSPAQSGERVYLQRLLKGKWRNQASTTIHRQKLPNGRTATGYAFKRTLSKKGSYSFRVITAATGYSLAGTSGRLAARAT